MQKETEKVVYIQPAAMPEMRGHAAQDASENASNSCTPVGTKFGPRMTYGVTIHAVIHLEQYSALLIRVDFYCLFATLKSSAMPCHALKGSPSWKDLITSIAEGSATCSGMRQSVFALHGAVQHQSRVAAFCSGSDYVSFADCSTLRPSGLGRLATPFSAATCPAVISFSRSVWRSPSCPRNASTGCHQLSRLRGRDGVAATGSLLAGRQKFLLKPLPQEAPAALCLGLLFALQMLGEGVA